MALADVNAIRASPAGAASRGMGRGGRLCNQSATRTTFIAVALIVCCWRQAKRSSRFLAHNWLSLNQSNHLTSDPSSDILAFAPRLYANTHALDGTPVGR